MAMRCGCKRRRSRRNCGARGRFQLYDLEADPEETRDIIAEQPAVAARLKPLLLAWDESVESSFSGKDYPEGRVTPPDPRSIPWTDHPDYRPCLPEWRKRPEYRRTSEPAKGEK
jgi:hypothetical protein